MESKTENKNEPKNEPKNEVKDFLTEMGKLPHVAGYESELVTYIAKVFSEFAEVTVDNFGNCIARVKPTTPTENAPKIMISAHMDEIGMMVSSIGGDGENSDGGFVYFSRVGGIDARNMVAQEVTIHGKEKVYGVIGIKPPHITKDQNKVVPLHDLAIDTGYSKAEIEKRVKVGDIITLNREVAELKGNKLTGRALDNTTGIAAMYCIMRNLRHFNHNADLYFVSSAQEEVGCRGAKTATYTIQPDIAIAIDVGFGRGGGTSDLESSELGNGPELGIGPNIHRKLFEALKKTAESHNTKFQVRVIPDMSGTDLREMQITKGGVYTALLSIPLDYMHSTVETVALPDVEACGKIISDYVIALQNETNWEDTLCWQ